MFIDQKSVSGQLAARQEPVIQLVIIPSEPKILGLVYKLVFLLFLLFGGLKKFNIKLRIDLNFIFKEFSKMSNSI